VFAWVRNAGVALILFAVWQVWGTSLSQHQAQDSLHQQFAAHVQETPLKSTTSTTPVGPTLVAAAVRLPEPAEGSAVAHLRIPAIGVDQYVVEGTAEGDLQKGPGHYIGTAMPGQAGNVAIAGHRTTYGAPFNNLNELAPGDAIDLTTLSGENLDYVVTQPPVPVAPSDVKILNSFGDNRLTLTTCNPRYSATQRLVVVALLREPAGAGVQTSPTPAAQARAKPRPVPSGGSVGWNLTYLPGVLAVLVFIVLLGLANRRAATYYGRRGRWLILVPIWLAATYVLFGLLSNLVPATL
jgi:sortase A